METVVELQGQMDDMQTALSDLQQQGQPVGDDYGDYDQLGESDDGVAPADPRRRKLTDFNLSKRISRAENNVVRLRNLLRYICTENNLKCDCKRKNEGRCSSNSDCCPNLKCNSNNKCVAK